MCVYLSACLSVCLCLCALLTSASSNQPHLFNCLVSRSFSNCLVDSPINLKEPQSAVVFLGQRQTTATIFFVFGQRHGRYSSAHRIWGLPKTVGRTYWESLNAYWYTNAIVYLDIASSLGIFFECSFRGPLRYAYIRFFSRAPSLACLCMCALLIWHTITLSLSLSLSLLLAHIRTHTLSHSISLSLVFPAFDTGQCVIHSLPLSLSPFTPSVSLARVLSLVRAFSLALSISPHHSCSRSCLNACGRAQTHFCFLAYSHPYSHSHSSVIATYW